MNENKKIWLFNNNSLDDIFCKLYNLIDGWVLSGCKYTEQINVIDICYPNYMYFMETVNKSNRGMAYKLYETKYTFIANVLIYIVYIQGLQA